MLPERFTKKIVVTVDGGCWVWTAAKNNQGYGVLTVGSRRLGTKRVVLAHRFSYESEVGAIPDGMELDHLCHRPICVNPNHLRPKDHSGNMQNSRSALKQFCKNGHERTPENTYVRKDRCGQKQCKVCNVEKNRRRYKPTGTPTNALKTHCKRGHEFTPENTVWLRNGTARQCRTCAQAQARDKYLQQKGGTKRG
jgi:hypothetical protein